MYVYLYYRERESNTIEGTKTIYLWKRNMLPSDRDWGIRIIHVPSQEGGDFSLWQCHQSRYRKGMVTSLVQ